MGWLWSSSPSQPAQQPPPPSSTPPQQSTTTTAPNEPEDPEIQKFFDLIKSEESATASSPQQQQQQQQPSKPSFLSRFTASDTSYEPKDAPRRDPVSESLLPTEMSCRQAFDLAWSCNSVGGQWNGVYRNGGMRSCSEQWNDFWFCMRTKSQTGPVKDEMVRTHYRNKEHAKYYEEGKHNSEEVWEARTQKLPPGSAMSGGFVPPEMSDQEWREMESERRRKIREDMGFNNPPSSS